MGDQDLVELVDGELEAREVRQRAAAEVDHEKVALRIADLDENAPRRLGASHPRVAAAENSDPQLAVFKLLGPRHEAVGVIAAGRSNHGSGRDRSHPTCERRGRQIAPVASLRIWSGHVGSQGPWRAQDHRLSLRDRRPSCVSRSPHRSHGGLAPPQRSLRDVDSPIIEMEFAGMRGTTANGATDRSRIRAPYLSFLLLTVAGLLAAGLVASPASAAPGCAKGGVVIQSAASVSR